jgi:hypothetical protein
MKRFLKLMHEIGGIGMTGALAAWWAMTQASLVMLCAATFVTGLYSAFSASLRFAAADVADVADVAEAHVSCRCRSDCI